MTKDWRIARCPCCQRYLFEWEFDGEEVCQRCIPHWREGTREFMATAAKAQKEREG